MQTLWPTVVMPQQRLTSSSLGSSRVISLIALHGSDSQWTGPRSTDTLPSPLARNTVQRTDALTGLVCLARTQGELESARHAAAETLSMLLIASWPGVLTQSSQLIQD